MTRFQSQQHYDPNNPDFLTPAGRELMREVAGWRSRPKRGLYCKRCRTDGWDYSVDACPKCGCKTLWCDEGPSTAQLEPSA